jgi:hypothetical protein
VNAPDTTMFRPRILSFAGLLALGFAFAPVRADVFWEFEDPADLPLERVAGSAGAPAWIGDLGRSMTTGRGALQLRNIGGGKAIASVPLGDLADGRPLWLLVRLDGWKLAGAGAREFAVGFSERVRPQRAVVQIGLRGSASRGLYVTGEALRSEEGAKNTRAIRVGEGAQAEPVGLVLEYRPAERVFNLHRSAADGSLTLLGSGLTSPRRNARFLHVVIQGDLGVAEGEFVDIGSIMVAGGQTGLSGGGGRR